VGDELLSASAIARAITRQMVHRVEWTVLVWQGVCAAVSLTVDHYRPGWSAVVWTVVAVNFAALPVIARFGGPFSRGPRWIVAAAVAAVAVQALPALAVVPGTYGAQPAATPMCNYPAATILMIAFYPWWRGERTRWVVALEYCFVGLVAVVPSLILALLDPAAGSPARVAAAFGGMYDLLGYLLGRAIGVMCRVAARNQLDVQRQHFEEFFNFLHSHVKAGVAAVRAESPDLPAMHAKLGELEQAVSDRRVAFLLAQHTVPLAALVSERVRTFHGAIRLRETPRAGAMTVRRPVGVLVGRALGDLLGNAVVHGARSAAVRMRSDGPDLVLEVEDDGPGFPDVVLDDAATSLHRLRADARAQGGDLRRTCVDGGGSRLVLTVPLRDARRRRPRAPAAG